MHRVLQLGGGTSVFLQISSGGTFIRKALVPILPNMCGLQRIKWICKTGLARLNIFHLAKQKRKVIFEGEEESDFSLFWRAK